MATTTEIDKWQLDSRGILNYRTTTTVTDDVPLTRSQIGTRTLKATFTYTTDID